MRFHLASFERSSALHNLISHIVWHERNAHLPSTVQVTLQIVSESRVPGEKTLYLTPVSDLRCLRLNRAYYCHRDISCTSFMVSKRSHDMPLSTAKLVAHGMMMCYLAIIVYILMIWSEVFPVLVSTKKALYLLGGISHKSSWPHPVLSDTVILGFF